VQAKPFFCEDVNAGSDDDPDLSVPGQEAPEQAQQQPEQPEQPAQPQQPAQQPEQQPAGAGGPSVEAVAQAVAEALAWAGVRAAAGAAGALADPEVPGPFARGHAAARAAYARSLGYDRFMDLVARVGGLPAVPGPVVHGGRGRAARCAAPRAGASAAAGLHPRRAAAPALLRPQVEAAYWQLAAQLAPLDGVLQPPACAPFMEAKFNWPFSRKHALQQASIIGAPPCLACCCAAPAPPAAALPAPPGLLLCGRPDPGGATRRACATRRRCAPPPWRRQHGIGRPAGARL
jgi:hypothetical protein